VLIVLLPKGRSLDFVARVTFVQVAWWLWWMTGGPMPSLRMTVLLLLRGKTGDL